MKVKLLQAAIAATLVAAPVASAVADVKIFGGVQVEYSNEDLEGQSAEQGVDDTNVYSNIGFRATEKLGNGMTAIAQLSFVVDPADATTNGLANDDSFVALQHKKWGFLGMGTFTSPYSTTGDRLDPFYETNLEAVGAGGMTSGGTVLGHDGAVGSAVYYRSPSWSNLTLDFVISPDEKNLGVKDAEVTVQDGDDNDFAISLSYEQGPIYAFAAYGQNNIENISTEEAFKIGGQFSMGAHTLSAQYEWVTDSNSLAAQNTNANGVSDFSEVTNTEDGDVWFLGYQFKMGNNQFVAQYGQTDSEDNGNDSEYFALGMFHHFSKKTSVFAGYSESDGNNNEADREVVTVGLRKNF
ncbi:MAG: porin [Methylococcales bacterium]|jgi:predicted porin|nr:porin [Methylococcales bacterium]MBT7442955.1 porin [Methylococcales bacterium]